MDKSELNREIVLCRSTVKKAKVRVIRKLIKKIKILRSCKNEKLREKKLRKARRLIAEMHEMKSLRPDYVTKFALLTENYVNTGSNTKLKRKRNACAKLAKYKEIVQKVSEIRCKFSNWQEVLPLMLQPAKKAKAGGSKAENDAKATASNAEPSNKKNNSRNLNETSPSLEEEEEEEEMNGDGCAPSKTTKKENEVLKIGKKVKDENELTKRERGTAAKNDKKDGEKVKNSRPIESNREKARKGSAGSGGDKESEAENQNRAAAPTKVDDPFFIGKKIVVPKLMQVVGENDSDSDNDERPRKNFDEDPRKSGKRNQVPPKSNRDELKKENSESDLHPSWKAKKMQVIKPFQGKKIIFE